MDVSKDSDGLYTIDIVQRQFRINDEGSGTRTLTAKNEKGDIIATFTITVIGRFIS